MNRTDIKKNILQKTDEVSPYSNTDEQWDLLIEGMLDDTANKFMRVIPIELIEAGDCCNFIPYQQRSHGTQFYVDLAFVYLPKDYNRFLYARTQHWRRMATEKDLFSTESGEYHRQFDIHTRAGVAKPKVFLEPATVYSRRFIVSPFRQNWHLIDLEFHYVKRIKAEQMQEDILDGFFYFAASHVLTSMRQPEFAKAMMEKFYEFLSLSTISNKRIHK